MVQPHAGPSALRRGGEAHRQQGAGRHPAPVRMVRVRGLGLARPGRDGAARARGHAGGGHRRPARRGAAARGGVRGGLRAAGAAVRHARVVGAAGHHGHLFPARGRPLFPVPAAQPPHRLQPQLRRRGVGHLRRGAGLFEHLGRLAAPLPRGHVRLQPPPVAAFCRALRAKAVAPPPRAGGAHRRQPLLVGARPVRVPLRARAGGHGGGGTEPAHPRCGAAALRPAPARGRPPARRLGRAARAAGAAPTRSLRAAPPAADARQPAPQARPAGAVAEGDRAPGYPQARPAVHAGGRVRIHGLAPLRAAPPRPHHGGDAPRAAAGLHHGAALVALGQGSAALVADAAAGGRAHLLHLRRHVRVAAAGLCRHPAHPRVVHRHLSGLLLDRLSLRPGRLHFFPATQRPVGQQRHPVAERLQPLAQKTPGAGAHTGLPEVFCAENRAHPAYHRLHGPGHGAFPDARPRRGVLVAAGGGHHRRADFFCNRGGVVHSAVFRAEGRDGETG